MKELKLNVEGMMCEGCENRIKNSVSKIDGVKKVEADHTSGTVMIEANDNVNEEQIKERITT